MPIIPILLNYRYNLKGKFQGVFGSLVHKLKSAHDITTYWRVNTPVDGRSKPPKLRGKQTRVFAHLGPPRLVAVENHPPSRYNSGSAPAGTGIHPPSSRQIVRVEEEIAFKLLEVPPQNRLSEDVNPQYGMRLFVSRTRGDEGYSPRFSNNEHEQKTRNGQVTIL